MFPIILYKFRGDIIAFTSFKCPFASDNWTDLDLLLLVLLVVVVCESRLKLKLDMVILVRGT